MKFHQNPNALDHVERNAHLIGALALLLVLFTSPLWMPEDGIKCESQIEVME